ncbi:MAG TPA: hypothetical protein VJ180_06915, partial [Pyrinomonadaceae bacterium]|nr:hypothetical protein [Pyrinomonadaceae bacterium]
GALRFIARLRGQETLDARSVDYPEPTDEFFGYTRIRIDDWYPPNHPAGTKELVATVSRVAATQVAVHTRQYIPGKLQAVQLYQEHIGGRWATFVETAFGVCKRQWQYLIPSRQSERVRLRQLCEQMLGFENEFLQKLPAV